MKFPRYRRGAPVTVKITAVRVIVALVIVGLVAACGAQALAPQAIEFHTQDLISQHYNQVQGVQVPTGKSRIRANLQEIENAQITGAQTTSFECAGQSGCDPTHPPIKSCASVGSPIPVTDQLTNPDQPLREDSQPLNNQGGNTVVGQMDPNGVYSGQGAGTYVLCITPGGAVIPSYWEGDVQVEFAPAVWKQGQGIVDVGPPSFQFSR